MDKMAQVTDWDKTVLAEDLARDGWAVSAAWQAADDPDNWTEYQDGTVGPEVIATSDQYDED